MSAAFAQLGFAAEFILFLASVAGVGVVVRAKLLAGEREGQLFLALGFTCLGIAAFVHGSLLQPDGTAAEIVIPRLFGLVLLAAGALRSGDANARRPIGLAVGLLAVAELITLLPVVDDIDWLADGARGLGALGLGSALLTTSQRSISARVAASATGTILLVVLAVSVALSAVVVDNVEEEALLRIQSRAAAEAAEIERAADDAVLSAKLGALVLSSSDDADDASRLITLADNPGSDVGALAADELRTDLGAIAENLVFEGAILAYVTSQGVVVGGVGVDSPAVQIDIAGSEVVSDTLAAQQGDRKSPAVVAGAALAAAASPVSVSVDGRSRFVGMVFAADPFDPGYLALRRESDRTLSLAVVGRDGVLASAGPQPATSTLTSAAGAVLDSAEPTRRVVNGLFVAAEPVTGGTEPVFAVVVSAPTTLVAQTRQQLFQTLFLVALGAALAALVLAALVGERIGSGLRRLTRTAEEIRTGNLDARAELDTADELGTLGNAFDSMAVALGDMTGELRMAAIDEARLRSRMEAVVAGMGEALLAVDATGTVTDFNAAAEELFDRPSSEVSGASISTLQLLGPQGEDITKRLAFPRLEPWSTTGTVVRRDDTKVPVAVSCGAVRGPVGEIAGGVAVLRDLRPEREIERMKTEFLANISHEWKTPLTPIKGYASMLSTRPLSREKTQDFASEILVSAGKLERVISRLVNFATVSAGRLELRTEAVVVRDLLDAARSRWKDRLGDLHTLQVRVARAIPDVEGDRRYLDQVLDELIDNAVKYSPDGGRVTISARAAGRAGNGSKPYIELAVGDEGVGILPERLGTIFGDFSQGDGSATREFGGLGLGLALVSHICEAHGGNLTCRSEVGEGSTFTLVLPAVITNLPSRRRAQPVVR
ncbi:hypothetical protein BH24ACT1_BH24ACT1_12970 [soil metagenome]